MEANPDIGNGQAETASDTWGGCPLTVRELAGCHLLNVEQVARLLSVPQATVKALHADRVLRGVRVGKYVRWKVAAVRAFVESLNPDG